RHHVVAVLVYLRDDLRERERIEGEERLGILAVHHVFRAAGELSPAFAPQGPEHAEGELVVTEGGTVERIRTAAAGKGAAEDHLVHVFIRGDGDAALVTPAAAVRQRQVIDNLQVIELRHQAQVDRGGRNVRLEDVAHRLQVHHQGVGGYVVGAQRTIVEGGRIVARD